MGFRPLLAPSESPQTYPDFFKKLQYPLLCSPKYDGIRGIVKDGVVFSRKGLAIPSAQVQYMFSSMEDFDGELIEGTPTDFNVCNRTTSYVMSEDKPGDLSFNVFDYTHPDWLKKPFYQRLEELERIVNSYYPFDCVNLVKHHNVDNEDELLEFEEDCLRQGFEGIIMRDPLATYKNGRGTYLQGIIYKLKRFEDAEGVVIGFEEQETNTNEKEIDPLGYSKRSSRKEGQVFAGTLGKFVIDYNGTILKVSPGNFTHAERKFIWESRDHFNNSILKFRFFGHGMKDLPRSPRAIGFRDRSDL